ncbi:MAG: hypothetical protein KY469_08295 [Actinobacteria bacterium]|nr:hypothetical protein [Actinomycetota bacterium]
MTGTSQEHARIEVVGGGEPTAEQVAALAIALTPVGVPELPRSHASGWQRAALHEGVGARPVSCRADVELL